MVRGLIQEAFGARASFLGAIPFGREHHPVNLEVRVGSHELQDRAPAPDLDVVTVCAYAQDRRDASGQAISDDDQRYGSLRETRSWRQTSQGASPLAYISSSRSLSRNVSIAVQNPVYL